MASLSALCAQGSYIFPDSVELGSQASVMSTLKPPHVAALEMYSRPRSQLRQIPARYVIDPFIIVSCTFVVLISLSGSL